MRSSLECPNAALFPSHCVTLLPNVKQKEKYENIQQHHVDEIARNVLLFLLGLSTALWSAATLDTTSLGALNVMGRDPFLVICLSTGRDCWTFVVGLNRADLDLLDRCLLGSLLALLGEVWNDPDGVEEIADTDSTGEEEAVQEQTEKR